VWPTLCFYISFARCVSPARGVEEPAALPGGSMFSLQQCVWHACVFIICEVVEILPRKGKEHGIFGVYAWKCGWGSVAAVARLWGSPRGQPKSWDASTVVVVVAVCEEKVVVGFSNGLDLESDLDLDWICGWY
jgi:hypothetical protein